MAIYGSRCTSYFQGPILRRLICPYKSATHPLSGKRNPVVPALLLERAPAKVVPSYDVTRPRRTQPMVCQQSRRRQPFPREADDIAAARLEPAYLGNHVRRVVPRRHEAQRLVELEARHAPTDLDLRAVLAMHQRRKRAGGGMRRAAARCCAGDTCGRAASSVYTPQIARARKGKEWTIVRSRRA